MKTCGKVVILEGPDGGGKTTFAKKLLALPLGLSAERELQLVHCGPFDRVTDGLARLYVEAMLPALHGYADVVLDRSWLSEGVYGPVFREGSRLPPYQVRMLERIALRCETQVVLCLPPLERCLQTFRERRGEEMLERESELTEVHGRYWRLESALPVRLYDFTATNASPTHVLALTQPSAPHAVHVGSAGNLQAPVVLVGEQFAEHKNQDPLVQHPFVSFNRAGCSAWLTEQLQGIVTEDQLLWVNADVGDQALALLISRYRRKAVVGLGVQAHAALRRLGVTFHSFNHPQHAKRFAHHAAYELITLLRSLS